MSTPGGWSRASLRIYSEGLRLGDVEAVLGLKATGQHLKGQQRSPRYKATWPDSMWRFGNTLKEDRGLEGNLTWLLDSLEPKRSGIRTLAEEYRVDFFCGLSSGDEQGGATLSSITLSRISKFGVPLIMNLSPPPPADSDEGGAGDPPRQPMVEDRRWSAAALRVIGDGLQRKKTDAVLALKATQFHSPQQWPIPGGEACWGSLWSLDSLLVDERSITEHLLSLLESLEPRLDAVRTISETYRVDLFCAFSSESGQGGFVLDGPTLARIATLGIPLGVELYLPGPIGQDEAKGESP